MSYKIVLTPFAKQNIDDAVFYYKTKASVKVARLFIDDYKRTFEDILKTKYFRFFFRDFRGKPMKKFPFIVFYNIDENTKIIYIKAVFNTKKDDQKYQNLK